MNALDPRFRRNVPALVTPCHADGSADLAGMQRLVAHVIAAGVDAVSILGTTGEFSLVPPAQRAPIIRAAVAAAGEMPVMVGCGRPSVSETLAEIEEAAACGASAVLVTPSYYFPLREDEIIAFFAALAASSPIPLVYYHYPQMTGCTLTASTIARMVASGTIAGIKDSSGDAAFFARLTALVGGRDEFRIFIGGSAFLLAALALGADGVTGALSNFAAHLDCALFDAFRSGDMGKARKAQAEIVRANDDLFFAFPCNVAATTKVILSALGVCGEAVFPPIVPPTAAERSAIRQRLPSFGISVS